MGYDGGSNGDISDYTDGELTPLTGTISPTSTVKWENLSRGTNDNNLNQRQQSNNVSKRQRYTSYAAMTASILALILSVGLFIFGVFRGWGGPPDSNDASGSSFESQFRLESKLYDENGRYILEDYDAKPAFSDFLPGLAGLYGKPMYAFYVNRGQGIASFGIQSKDYPLLEFKSANKAYESTALLGFRTFLQGSRGSHSFLSEPFSPLSTRFEEHEAAVDPSADMAFKLNHNPRDMLPKRYMYIGDNEMQLRELDEVNLVETNVTYFILPEEDFGAFVRRTSITNTAKKGEPLTLSLLDGLVRMEPAGGKLNGLLKEMGRTLEGWMNVYQARDDTLHMPYYRISSKPSDTEFTEVQVAGHYCLSIIEGDDSSLDGEPSPLLPIVYDPSKIFGEDTTFLNPIRLLAKSVGEIISEPQYGAAKTPSAFAAVDSVTLEPGQTLTLSTFFGKAQHILDVPVIARRIAQPGFAQYKFSRAREIVRQITAQVETNTASKLFNGHVKQMFLDSSLNGGIPSLLGEVDDDARMRTSDEDHRLKVFHLFSRIHGDLERDYNFFKVSPTFFSEGPGRFNDLAQQRRNDVFFNPRIGSFNVMMFLAFVQADGYNPLIIESVAFTIANKITCDQIAADAVGQADGHRAQREALSGILNGGPFRPGQLFELMEEANIELVIPQHTFIDRVTAAAQIFSMGSFEAGFWADHFTYYMDFIESYLAVYPDQEEHMLFEPHLKYFYSPVTVRPRSQKYVLSLNYNGVGHHVRQLDTVVADDEKENMRMRYFSNASGWYDLEADWQHDASADLFTSTPVGKLVLLAALKFATRDAYGMGIEYEAGKPGYNTANNGIVAMIGSGCAEAYELLVLVRYLSTVVQKYPRSIKVPEELADLIESINNALHVLSKSKIKDDQSDTVPQERFDYWDAVAQAREEYRERVRIVFSGKTVHLDHATMASTFQKWIVELEEGIERAVYFGTHGHDDDGSRGLAPTYFSYEVTSWVRNGYYNARAHPLVNATEMTVKRFPLFLEGPTRMIKTAPLEQAKDIYDKIRKSPLRDEKLDMYMLSASLEGQTLDIGRVMAFADGWLENGSVWLEMSYKLYFALLRNDMLDDFYREMRSGGMLPFVNQQKYGRSPLECSAFIASSKFEDPSTQGRGFQARLSGATSEFLSIWVGMLIGRKPFFIDDRTGELQMQLVPALPGWLFIEGENDDEADLTVSRVSFKLFGSIDVNYYKEREGGLFRTAPYRYVVGYRDGSTFQVDGPIIPFGLAEKIRRVVFVASIDVFFK